MKTTAAALALTAMIALTASAGERHSSGVRHISSGPFRVGASGHSFSGSGGAASPRGLGSAAPRAGTHSTFAPSRPRAFAGGGGGGAAPRAANNSFWGQGNRLSVARWAMTPRGLRRVGPSDGSSGGSTTSDPTTPDTLPQGAFGTVPGALLRSEGVGYLYAPGDSGRVHSVEAGDRVAFQDNLGHATSGMGTHVGPRDTPPGLNPHGEASGANAITPNTNISIDNSSTDNSSTDNSSSGGGGIHDYGHGHDH